jgi:signal transduction histidine kinase
VPRAFRGWGFWFSSTTAGWQKIARHFPEKMPSLSAHVQDGLTTWPDVRCVRKPINGNESVKDSGTFAWSDHEPEQFGSLLKRSLVLGGALVLVAVIGWVDYISGWEFSLFVFYAIPLLMVVWQGYPRLAVVLAMLCGLIWWLANEADHPYSQLWSYHWASIGRTVYFVLVALGANALRARQKTDKALIETLRKMRSLEREVVESGEHEQQRIGRDLHDGLCQQLAAIGFSARSLANELSARHPLEANKAVEIEKLLQDSVKLARDLARGICPVLSDGMALEGALDELANTTRRLTGIDVSFHHEGEELTLDSHVSTHLYRIAQEALNNALHHSQAERIEIRLCVHGQSLRLTIADDGIGMFNGSPARKGMGMKTMEYRSQAAGAQLEIVQNEPKGTLISCVCQTQKPTA